MNLKRLRDIIADVADLVGASGTKRSADDVRALAQVLHGPDGRSADESIDELEDLISEEERLARESYVKRLLGAGTDKSSFEPVYAELKNDRCILKEDADAIAHDYTKGRKSWPSRKAALDAIRKKFVERAYQESKMRIVEKSKVW
jgi:hypothetical protein